MKKIKAIVLAFVVFMSSTSYVRALCDAAEENRIRSLASNVRASYEIVKEELEPGTYSPPDGISEEEYVGTVDVINIYIANLTEDLYIEVEDTLTKETKKYTYQDSTNGTITLKKYDFGSIDKYEISVYSNKTDCISDRKLKNIEVKTPMYNDISRYGICEGLEEYYLCYEYIDYDINMSFSEAEAKIEKYRESKEKKEQEQHEEEKSFKKFIKNNAGTIIIVTAVIIGVGVGATIVVIKRRGRVV